MKETLSLIFFILFILSMSVSLAASEQNRDSLHACLLRAAEKFYGCQIRCGYDNPGSQQCIDGCYKDREDDEKACYDKYR